MRADNVKLFHDSLDVIDNNIHTGVFKFIEAIKSSVRVTTLETKVPMEL